MRRLWLALLACAAAAVVSAQAVPAAPRQFAAGGRLTGVGLTVTITSPTSASTYDAGTASTVTLGGAALSDRVVTSCTYTNSLGGSGTATGTTAWSTPDGIALTVGSNVITVTCTNAEGTSANDVLTVTRSASGGACTVNCLYVNNSGTPACSDATTKASNTAATPWCSIARAAWGSTTRSAMSAAQAAAAGDTVVITTGTYNITSGLTANTDEKNPVYQTANSGTAGNLITFTPTGGIVTLQSTTWSGPVIGQYQRNYVSWDGLTPGGFYIDEDNVNSRADTGPVGCWESTGSVLANLEINGAIKSFGDNHNGIRLEDCISGTVRNNEIYDIGENNPSPNHNTALIMLYDTRDCVIEHNELYGLGTGSGIFVKGDHGTGQSGNIIRFNIIRDIASPGKGIALLASQDNLIYQNLFKGLQYAISLQFLASSATGHPFDDIIANNTFYDNDHCLIFEGGTIFAHNVRFFNNICSNNTVYAIAAEDAANPSDLDAEHNVYFTSATFAFFGSNQTFTQWKTNFGEDAVAPASVTTNPLFVTAGSDFHLQASSSADNLGVDLLDLDGDASTVDNIDAGMYVTGSEVIGIVP